MLDLEIRRCYFRLVNEKDRSAGATDVLPCTPLPACYCSSNQGKNNRSPQHHAQFLYIILFCLFNIVCGALNYDGLP